MRAGRRWFAVVVLALVLSAAAAAPALAGTFSDVGEGDWFAQSVDELSNAGIIQGYPDDTFRPYETVTRAQFAAMMDRALQPPDVQGEPFEDVYSTDWFYASVARLYNAGLINGVSATSFAPYNGIAREQAASLVVRALRYQIDQGLIEGLSLDLSETEILGWLGTLRDRWFISDPHRGNIANTIRLSIMLGDTEQRFYPMLTLTRAQAAGILYRALFGPLEIRTEIPPSVPGIPAYPTFYMSSSGPMVTYLQNSLAALGYNVGSINGQFGESTKDAVMAFQKVEGLLRDGEAGGQVWNALLSAERPSPGRSRGGTRVEVDLSKQVLYYIENNVVREILSCSSGTLGWTTATGVYSIFRKDPDWQQSPLGYLYYPAYFNGGVAIHGSWSVPAYPASHGCIRIPVWATVSLYYRMFFGMTVDVYYS